MTSSVADGYLGPGIIGNCLRQALLSTAVACQVYGHVVVVPLGGGGWGRRYNICVCTRGCMKIMCTHWHRVCQQRVKNQLNVWWATYNDEHNTHTHQCQCTALTIGHNQTWHVYLWENPFNHFGWYPVPDKFVVTSIHLVSSIMDGVLPIIINSVVEFHSCHFRHVMHKCPNVEIPKRHERMDTTHQRECHKRWYQRWTKVETNIRDHIM